MFLLPLIYSLFGSSNSAYFFVILSAILISYILRFWINYRYAGKLGAPNHYKIPASIFDPIGFIFLLGYDANLISTIDILKQSWECYAKNWRHFIGYALLIIVPTFVVSILGAILGNIGLSANTFSYTITVIFFIVMLISILLSFWAHLAMASSMLSLLRSEPAKEWQTVLFQTARLLWTAIYTSLLALLVLASGYIVTLALFFLKFVNAAIFILIIWTILGLVLSIWYVFINYEVLDGKKGWGAMKESRELVVGRWWAIVWRFIVPSLIFGIIVGITQSVFNLPIVILSMIFGDKSLASPIITIVVQCAVSVFGVPLVAIPMILLYINAKNNPKKVQTFIDSPLEA